jgi:hypothetical protein
MSEADGLSWRMPPLALVISVLFLVVKAVQIGGS